MDKYKNERGATLITTIILLFFVSNFLFSMQLWHDSLYRTYSSLEMYYEKEVIHYLNNTSDENELPLVDTQEELGTGLLK